MQAIIGHTGLIGQLLAKQLKFDHYYTSSNISDLPKFRYDTVYCAAPSGNRIAAEKYPDQDIDSINKLINALTKSSINRIILISTCDTQVNPESHYGRNRLLLENIVRSNWKNYHILRLSSLIHATIKKNILYDIRTQQYLNKINPTVHLQWYPLDDLISDIQKCLDNDIRELNLCSEPISNQLVIDTFAQHLTNQICTHNLGKNYNLQPWSYTTEQILKRMDEYFQCFVCLDSN